MKPWTLAQIKAHIRNGPKATREWAEAEAKKMAKEVREDVHVYMHRGWFNLTAGPDLDHPKTPATFIVPFKQRAVKEKAKDRVYD